MSRVICVLERFGMLGFLIREKAFLRWVWTISRTAESHYCSKKQFVQPKTGLKESQCLGPEVAQID